MTKDLPIIIQLLMKTIGGQMFSHMAWALKQPIDDALAKWVLVTLCDFTDQDGKCWPSQSLLQQRTSIGRSTLNKKLKLLEESGYITRFSGRTGFNTEYYVHAEVVSHRDTPVSQRDTKQSLTRNNNKRKEFRGLATIRRS